MPQKTFLNTPKAEFQSFSRLNDQTQAPYRITIEGEDGRPKAAVFF